jgi:serine/alanine adding enzyme
VSLEVGDAYFRRDYAEISAVLEGGEAVVLEADEAVFPVVVREASGVKDVTNPYGFGGAVAVDEDAGRRFYDTYRRWCEENGIVTSFIRFHPLLENHRYAEPLFHLEPVAGSVSWRLDGDLFAGMHTHHRRAVRKAERSGIEVVAREAPGSLNAFATLYEATMRRQQASAFYFFPEAYWRGLGGREWLLLLEAHAGAETVAAVLCLATPPWLHYHLGASADAARSTGASHLLIYSAACWGQERSYEQFHLGAGVGGTGGALLEWKRRFYPSELRDQWIGKAVHDRERYLALTGASTVDYEGFFPAYRRD